ncbi:mandelate racemase/muconate lactonizing enzyme family protein [Halorarum halobium]|uniref:mandelate racemase/muconate lactonizing enzyme family protein n=1 Tax=Halorarum halobium TaxID=3075121 RepID=UPI0028A62947|nr:enolase C-terminal domain-like protein [Halobaculum sp. XH14]
MPAFDARLREFSLPLRSPLGTATGELATRDVTILTLAAETADGDPVRGVGEAAPLPPWTEDGETCRAALSDVQETLRGGGDVPLEAHPLDDRLIEDLPPAARHAVTLATADAEARVEGVPLASELAERAAIDADPAETVPANATVGDGSVAETVSAATSAVEAGFDCLKCKVGARDLDADLDRLRAVRAAVGDDASLRADANGAWSLAAAERAMDALADLGFEYVEQPVPADAHEDLAALRGRGVDLALDESVNAAGEWPRPIPEYADVAVLKPMAQGGPGATAALARHLDSQGVAPVVTTTIDAAVARTAAVHVAAAVPGGGERTHGLATADLLAEDVAHDPVPVEDGRIRVPAGPGLAGDAFDELR